MKVACLVLCVLICARADAASTGSAMVDYETIVVGMGAAGTTAASTLARAGVKVLALEAMDRIGGRVHTVPFGDGVIEMGAEWIHGTSPSRTYDLATKNGVKLIEQDVSIEVYKSDGSKANSSLFNELMNQAMGSVNDQLELSEPLGEFLTRQQQSLSDLATKNGVKLIEQDVSIEVYKSDGSKANSSLFNELMNQAMGSVNDQLELSEPLGEFLTRQVTEYLKEHYPDVLEDKDFFEELLHLLDLVVDNYESSNSWNDVTTNSQYQELGGHQHVSWGASGYKTLFDILLNKYNNGSGLPSLTVKLNSEVTNIDYSTAPVTVTTADGARYTANNVIVTVSLGVLKARHKQLFDPKLPEPKQIAIDKISIGVMDKIVFLFERPWWPVIEPAFFGFLWKGEDKKRIPDEDYWLYRVFAASTPKGCKHALTLWTSGEVGKMVETMPEDVVRTKLMGLIRRFMGKDVEVPEPIEMVRSTWFHNPYTRGSYTYDNLLSPQYPTARADLGAPITDSAGNLRVLFAGEATDPHHFSTVHGATDTGHREATRLLERRAKSHL